MSCNCCCTKVLDFCKQKVCDEIDFDILAQVSGVHKMVTYFLGAQITIEADLAPGDKMVFPINALNESFMYTVELYDPNGVRIQIKKDDVDYDCFRFQTTVAVFYS